MLFVVSGPSGVGKSTLCAELLAEFERLTLSVSCTTRAPRGQEVDGVHYHFLTPERFDGLVIEEAFVEWAEVHGNRYGTTKEAVRDAQQQGRDLLFDIDYQGARSIKEFDETAVTVLVTPPSLEELERRLRSRGEDADDVIARRVAKAAEELSHAWLFDYVIPNEHLSTARDAMRSIYVGEGYRRHRQQSVLDGLNV